MDDKIKQLGQRLKKARLERNDPQKEFAFRIGVSIPTLYKMEQGDPSISIGKWKEALAVLGRLDDLDYLLSPQKSLFEEIRNQKKGKPRQRARRKGKKDDLVRR